MYLTPEIKKEEGKIETTPNIPKNKIVESTTPENNSSKNEIKKIFTKEDLFKIGTEFKYKGVNFTITKIPGLFSNMLGVGKIEFKFKDKDGKEQIQSEKKRNLKNKFTNNEIKITKTLESK